MSMLGVTIITALSSSMLLGNIFTLGGKLIELLTRIISLPLDLYYGIKNTISQAQFFLGRLIATNFGVFFAVVLILCLAIYAIYYIVVKKADK